MGIRQDEKAQRELVERIWEGKESPESIIANHWVSVGSSDFLVEVIDAVSNGCEGRGRDDLLCGLKSLMWRALYREDQRNRIDRLVKLMEADDGRSFPGASDQIEMYQSYLSPSRPNAHLMHYRRYMQPTIDRMYQEAVEAGFDGMFADMSTERPALEPAAPTLLLTGRKAV